MNLGMPGRFADAVDLDIGIAQRVQHVTERPAHQATPLFRTRLICSGVMTIASRKLRRRA